MTMKDFQSQIYETLYQATKSVYSRTVFKDRLPIQTITFKACLFVFVKNNAVLPNVTIFFTFQKG